MSVSVSFIRKTRIMLSQIRRRRTGTTRKNEIVMTMASKLDQVPLNVFLTSHTMPQIHEVSKPNRNRISTILGVTILRNCMKSFINDPLSFLEANIPQRGMLEPGFSYDEYSNDRQPAPPPGDQMTLGAWTRTTKGPGFERFVAHDD